MIFLNQNIRSTLNKNRSNVQVFKNFQKNLLLKMLKFEIIEEIICITIT